MKKSILFATIIIILAISGCSPAGGEDDLILIEERFFVHRMRDIFLSPSEYMGRTIQYEGIFRILTWYDEELIQVFRYTEGCCGPDGILGFEIRADSIEIEHIPNGAWVEVKGILEEFSARGHRFIRIDALSLTEMEERGEEFVSIRQ